MASSSVSPFPSRASIPAVVVTGADGQLGQTLKALWAQSPLRESYQLVGLNKASVDITDSEQLSQRLNRLEVAALINAAAYTAVDTAETRREQAFAVNEHGAANLATWAALSGCKFIHLSTDFVFDGRQTHPYLPDDDPAPLGVYGASKLAGERAVLARCPQALVLRTSWLYSPYGKNFVRTMLGLMSQRDSLKVVNDQIGSPTATRTLAQVLLAMVASEAPGGIYHWTDGGALSWYDFAVAIQAEALDLGLLSRSIPIEPIPTSEYPTPAKRPSYSVLDTETTQAQFDCPPQDWRAQLRRTLTELGGHKDSRA